MYNSINERNVPKGVSFCCSFILMTDPTLDNLIAIKIFSPDDRLSVHTYMVIIIDNYTHTFRLQFVLFIIFSNGAIITLSCRHIPDVPLMLVSSRVI